MRKRFQSFMGNSYDAPLNDTKTRSCSTSYMDSTTFSDSPTHVSPTSKSVKRQASTVSLHLKIKQKHKKSSVELPTIDSDLEENFEESSNDSVFSDCYDNITRTILAPILPPEAAPLKSPSSPPVSTLPRFIKNGKLRKSQSLKATSKDANYVIILNVYDILNI